MFDSFTLLNVWIHNWLNRQEHRLKYNGYKLTAVNNVLRQNQNNFHFCPRCIIPTQKNSKPLVTSAINHANCKLFLKVVFS